MKTESKQKIPLAAISALVLCAALLCIPPVRDALIRLGGALLGRPLNFPEIWQSRMRRLAAVLALSAAWLCAVTFLDARKAAELYAARKSAIDAAGVCVTFAFLAFCYAFRCTESSLWFDEGIEYWVSKSLSGPAYGFVAEKSTMYERILLTIQGPLYNVLMFLWLKISDTEFWFRFFGVVCFWAGCVAFFKACAEFTNKIIACLMTLIFGTSRVFIDYAHEAAEYTILFCCICWMMYYFVLSLKRFSWKNTILYFVFAVLSIYSQYGASFVILGTAIVLFIRCFTGDGAETKQEKLLRFLVPAGAATVAFVVPLFVFFASRQLFSVIETNDHTPAFEHSVILVDYAKSFMSASSYFLKRGLVMIAVVLSLCVLAKKIITKNFNATPFGGICLALFISWTVYYLAVRFNIYKTSYTSGFGNRWGMSFGAIVGLFAAMSFTTFYEMFHHRALRYASTLVFPILGLIFLGSNVTDVILGHNIKCHVRETYEHLNKSDVKPIIIDERFVPTFAFYVLHDKDSNLSMELSHTFASHSENAPRELLEKQITDILRKMDAESFYYLCGGDDPTNLESVLEILEEMGFRVVETFQFEGRNSEDPISWKVEKTVR